MTCLSDAIQEYLDSRKARGKKAGTVTNEKVRLRQFLATVGNIEVRNVTSRHIDMHFAARPDISPGTFNNHRATLTKFFQWCRSRRYLAKDADPLEGLDKLKVTQRERIFVPRERFTELLDASADRRDRMVVALGLYLFTGAAEINRLLWRHVHIDDDNPKKWYAQVWRKKTGKYEDLPVMGPLATELRRWRLEYATMAGSPPRGDWHVIPAYKPRFFVQGVKGTITDAELNPTRPYVRCAEAVNRSLGAIGYTERELEGNHTLRRSGGLALYEELAWNRGHDAALRVVQFMYMHESIQTTEKYLRLSLERKRSLDLLAGEDIYAQPEGEVIDLGQASSRASEL